MKVELSTQNVRSMLPARVIISECPANVSVEVKSADTESSWFKPFAVELTRKQPSQCEGEVVIAAPGKYQVTAYSGELVVTKELLVAEQKYLEFGSEFGAFASLFIIMMAGMILWVRKKMK